jgi:hypothetical protein
VTEAQYRKLLTRQPDARQQQWQTLRRGMQVYVKGAIRHPDHATIVLPYWHEVLMNNEAISTRLAFLD